MNQLIIEEKDLEYIESRLKDEFNAISGKNLLITGGAGFLGYYLTKSALFWNDRNNDNAPINLWIFDNFSRGVPKWIESFRTRKDVQVRKYDIIKPISQQYPIFSYIIHAASIASPIYYRLHPIETMDANVQGLRNLLDYALKQKANNHPIEALLFFSSSEIYGDPVPDAIPTPETYRGNVSCTGPRACYDESKRYGETLCVNFARYYGVPIKIVRPFNNYGPGLKLTDKRVIPDFAKNIFSNEDIILHSNGSPTRTFCYVADAVIGYYKALIRGLSGEAYNIGVEKPEIAVNDLAQEILIIGREHFDYKGNVIFKTSNDSDYLTDTPNRRCPCISKARQDLGYSPSIELEDGLLRTMYWYNDNREGEDK